MLDRVERRRLLVQPSGKDPLELILRIADVELDECAGELLLLPGGARLAGPQAHDHLADAKRLSRLHFQVSGNAVAFVEQADHRDPLRHRGRPRRDGGDRLRNIDGFRLGLGLAVALPLRSIPWIAAAGGEKDQDAQDGGGAQRRLHARSGVHAS